MNFNLKRPCAKCPFRTDCLPGWLGERRAAGIFETLDQGNTFTCHETKNSKAPAQQHCAGALILLKKAHGGVTGALALACLFGWLDLNALDLDAPVFDSPEEFIEHHKWEEREP